MGIDPSAGHDEIERALGPDEPRKTLGSARSWNDSPRDFGQTEGGVLTRDAKVAGESDLEALLRGNGLRWLR